MHTDAGSDYNFDSRWWTAPVAKITRRLAQVSDETNELAVLVTTGAFCPIHEGHLQLLETAKRELESRGTTVLGGYICPDHDQYVSSKIRFRSLSAAQRLELCELAVEESDWLMVDRWAAIYASGSVGFTTIVDHIDKMIKQHVMTTKPIRIVYTFGGDNAMFAFSFVSIWSCICVLRPGSLDNFDDITAYDSLRKNPRIIFSRDTTAALDSTRIRNGDLSSLLPKVRDRYLSMQRVEHDAIGRKAPTLSTSMDPLYLRNERLRAIRSLLPTSKRSFGAVSKAYDAFCEGLRRVFELSLGPSATVQPIDLQNQQTVLDEKTAKHGKIISFDPCLSGSHDLRLWHIHEPLVKTSTAIFAPRGQQVDATQVARFEAGAYTVLAENLPIDADTQRLITERLPNSCSIVGYISRMDLVRATGGYMAKLKKNTSGTVINARDYLVGSHEGGTVLQLGDEQLVRAPSIIPYVRPFLNVNVDATLEMGFSKQVWDLNLQFFQAIGANITVKDMAPEFQALCRVHGFPEDMCMSEFCDWHITAFNDMHYVEIEDNAWRAAA